MPTANPANRHGGLTIRSWRKHLGWDLAALAAHSGYSVTYISDIERGTRTASDRAALAIEGALVRETLTRHDSKKAAVL